MTRRQEIESIIIGTILSSHLGEDYLKDCKSCITADMFCDERNSLIYSKAVEMYSKGFSEITPYTLVNYDSSLLPVAPYMCEVADDWYFESKKTSYNLKLYYGCTNGTERPKYTRVTFSDYVTRFVQLVYSS